MCQDYSTARATRASIHQAATLCLLMKTALMEAEACRRGGSDEVDAQGIHLADMYKVGHPLKIVLKDINGIFNNKMATGRHPN